MARRKRIFFLVWGVVSILAICGIGLRQVYRPDRMIQGRREGEWIRSVTNINTVDYGQWAKLGREAVPILVEAADYKGGARGSTYAAIWSRLPGPVRRKFSPPGDYTKFRLAALARMGSVRIDRDQFPVVLPLLVRCLSDPNPGVRANAINLLSNRICPQMGSERETYLPPVIRATADTNAFVRMIAAAGLQCFSNRPDLVFPALTNAMQDYDADVRIRAAMSAYYLDPVWASNSGALNVAQDCIRLSTPHGAELLAKQFLEKIGQYQEPQGW